MSSTTTSITASPAVAATVADTVVKPAKKFPPPCWTQDETLVLIDAYRERWYALRRGYLRTADWDAVAETVATRCPDSSPAKTSAQCRHKMEKLRQRYRAEKQRSLSYPHHAGRYFSSWFFFDNMEAMENGTAPSSSVQKSENPVDGSRFNSYLDQNTLKLKLKAKGTADSSSNLGFYNDVKSKRFNSDTTISTEYSPSLDMETADKEEEDMPVDEDLINFGMRKPMNAMPIPPLKSKTKNSGKIFSNNFDVSGGFHQDMLPPGLRVKKFGKLNNGNNSNEEFWVKVSNESNNDNNNFAAPGFRAKHRASCVDSRAAVNGLKRERDAVEEMVTSIKLLGEGFMKMERAKMEMAREMEAMRMEMEMKRNEMILESQKQIVGAFVKGMLEIKKNKKMKTGIADSAEASA